MNSEKAERLTRPELLLSILKRNGPTLSSKITAELAKLGIEKENARKIVQRGAPGVTALKKIRFPHNETFLFLRSDYRTDSFYKSLVAALRETRSVYGIALDGMSSYGYIIPAKRFPILSGSPLLLKKHIAAERVLKNLVDSGVLSQATVNKQRFVSVTSLASLPVGTIQELKAREVAEKIVTEAFIDWVRKVGLVSFNSVKNRFKGPKPQFGQFAWDISAPSYIHPLARFQNKVLKPGFLVADTVLGNVLDERHVEYFINKASILRQQSNMSPFVAFLIGDLFSKNALHRGKSRGLIFTTPGALFGKDVGDALRELIKTLTNAAVLATKDPDRIPQLFHDLAKVESAVDTLRGPLFEMIVAYIASSRAGGWVTIGEIATSASDKTKKAEMDVLHRKSDKIDVYECKGHRASTEISVPEIEYWLHKQVPRIRSFLQSKYQNSDIEFHFWTTGVFSTEASELLQESSSKTKKYKINWKSRNEVIGELKIIKAPRLVDVIRNYYSAK